MVRPNSISFLTEGTRMPVELDDIISPEEREAIHQGVRAQIERLLKELGVEGVYIAALKVKEGGAWTIDDWFWPAIGGPSLDMVLAERIRELSKGTAPVDQDKPPKKGRLN
jgi:hypothetical protein